MTGRVVHLPARHAPGRLLTKKQLAAELGRSTRWVELRMREGLPNAPRATPNEHARYDLEAVHAWIETRAQTQPVPLAQRVATLERMVARLAAEVERKAS